MLYRLTKYYAQNFWFHVPTVVVKIVAAKRWNGISSAASKGTKSVLTRIWAAPGPDILQY
jgi:hypothetical protein